MRLKTYLDNLISTCLLRSQVLLASASFIAASIFPMSASAAGDWQKSTINMVGVKNFFMERCVEFGAGEEIAYRFSSLHPLKFNVHYHPAKETRFKVEKENITQLSGAFTSDTKDHYCFTWTNPADVGGEWPVTLEYRVSTMQ